MAASSRSTSRRRRRCPASIASSPSTTSRPSSPIRSTARPSTTSRSSPTARCTMSASRWRWCSPPIRISRRRRPSLIEADYEELPAVFDEIEAMTSKAVVHDELKPAGTFPDLKHLKGKKDTNIALDFHLRRGDPAEGVRGGRACVRAYLPQPAGAACAARAVRLRCGADRDRAHHPHGVAVAVVRAHRDRAAAWAGPRTRCA